MRKISKKSVLNIAFSILMIAICIYNPDLAIFILSTVILVRTVFRGKLRKRIYVTGNVILSVFYFLNIALNIHAAFNCWTLSTSLISTFSECMMMFGVVLTIAAEALENEIL